MTKKTATKVKQTLPATTATVLPAEVVKAVALPKIKPQDKKFCGHYAIYANGAEAVRNAGYKTTAPYQFAHNLLTKADIQAHVEAARTKLGEIHFDIGNQIIQQLNRMRAADVTALYDEKGNLTDMKTWPEELKLLVNGIEIEEETRGTGDAAYTVRTKKVRLESRKGVMDTLAKILGVLKSGAGEGGDGDGYADPRPKFPTAVIFQISVGEVKP